MDSSIGVAVITHRAKHHLKHCLPPLIESPTKPRVLVVNSSSFDGTVEEAERLGAETLVVPRHTFNHGSTRELARKHLGTDIVIMITPDAYAEDSSLIEKLTLPLRNGDVSIAYGRQLPHRGAGVFESFSREYNYPALSHIRGIEDLDTYGIYTFFCSNSCCAWNNQALDSIGGFTHVLLGEDTVAAAKLLRQGHKIAYVSEARIHHSHSYTLWQEFQRHYDTGLARKQYGDLLSEAGKDSKRGKAYTLSLFRKLLHTRKRLLPYAVLQTLAKWAGYQLGRTTVNAPVTCKRLFSSQDFYWINETGIEVSK